jgi:hypothetical protein
MTTSERFFISCLETVLQEMPLNLIIRAIRSAKWPETCGCISGEKSH